MKLSIIISVYNSHGALDRQIKHFNSMNLPDDIEIIIVDDGSNPPLKESDYKLKNLHIYATNNQLAWTQGLGRNVGAQKAKGEYLLFTDLDHILSKEAITDVYRTSEDRLMFKRYFGILDEDGKLHQDLETLRDYGLDVDHIKKSRGLYAGVHLNTFAIKRTTFDSLGGYDPKHSSDGLHPVSRKGDDCYFNTKWNHYARKNNIQLKMGSLIYVFPIGRFHINGDTNPKGLFHDLKYDGKEKLMKGQEYAN